MAGMTDITRHGNNKKERMISGVGVKEDALLDFGNQEQQVYVDDTDDFDTYTKGPGLISHITKAGIAVCMFPVLLLKGLPKLFGKIKFLPEMFKKIVPAFKKIPAFCVVALKYTGIPWVFGKCAGFLAAKKEKSKSIKEKKEKEQFVPLSQAVAFREKDKPVDTIEFSQATPKQSSPQSAVPKKSATPSAVQADVDGEDPFAEPPRWSMKKRLTFAAACSILLCVCYITGKNLLRSNATEPGNDEVAANMDSVSIDDFNEDAFALPSSNSSLFSPSYGDPVSPPPPMGLPQSNYSSSGGFTPAPLPDLPVPSGSNHELASMEQVPLPPPLENDDRILEDQFRSSPLPGNQGLHTNVYENPRDIVDNEPMFPAIPTASTAPLTIASGSSSQTMPQTTMPAASLSEPMLHSAPGNVPQTISMTQTPEPGNHGSISRTITPDEGLSIPDQPASMFAATASNPTRPTASPMASLTDSNPPGDSGFVNASGGLFNDVAQNSSQRNDYPATMTNTPVASRGQESYALQPTRQDMETETPLVIPDAASASLNPSSPVPQANHSLFAAVNSSAPPATSSTANHHDTRWSEPQHSTPLQENRMASSSPTPSLFQQMSPSQEEAMDVVGPVAAVERSPRMMQEGTAVLSSPARDFTDLNLQTSTTENQGLFSQAITTVSTQPQTAMMQNIQNDQQTGRNFQSLNDIPLTSPIEEDGHVLSPSQINRFSTQTAPVGEAYSTRVPSHLPDEERVARIRARLRSLKESDQARDAASGFAAGANQRSVTRSSYHGETKNYILQEGDTWWSVAKRELNDVRRWREIRDLNKDQIDSIEALQPGMEILLPAD